jgi:hypothetical protein
MWLSIPDQIQKQKVVFIAWPYVQFHPYGRPLAPEFRYHGSYFVPQCERNVAVCLRVVPILAWPNAFASSVESTAMCGKLPVFLHSFYQIESAPVLILRSSDLLNDHACVHIPGSSTSWRVTHLIILQITLARVDLTVLRVITFTGFSVVLER